MFKFTTFYNIPHVQIELMDGVQHIPRIVVQKETNLKVWKAVLSSFVCCYQPPLRERLGWPPLASLSPHCQLDGHEIFACSCQSYY